MVKDVPSGAPRRSGPDPFAPQHILRNRPEPDSAEHTGVYKRKQANHATDNEKGFDRAQESPKIAPQESESPVCGSWRFACLDTSAANDANWAAERGLAAIQRTNAGSG